MAERRFPHFYYSDMPLTELGIPVFTFHSIAERNTPDSISPAQFEAQMRYLAENQYQTLHADDLYAYLVSGKTMPEKSVVLTFDDGRATLWTVAFPILKRYGLKAVSFLVPARIPEQGVRLTLAQVAEATGRGFDLINVDLSDKPTLSWQEIQIMHHSGLIDFQSHTLDHALIFYKPEIVDFIHPGFAFKFDNYGVPMLRVANQDCIGQRPPLGTPIYRYQSRMAAARRFFDDESLRFACQAYVNTAGQQRFFEHPNWRTRLVDFVADYRRGHRLNEAYERNEEQIQAIQRSLLSSKQIIEEHLPGHCVRHLCYPWHIYSGLTVSLAHEAGYVTNFIDINPQKPWPNWNDPYVVQKLLPINEYGDDPYQITRIDATDEMILSLPGKGRRSYWQRQFAQLITKSRRYLCSPK